jgi:hypothetical protein
MKEPIFKAIECHPGIMRPKEGSQRHLTGDSKSADYSVT